MKNLFKAALICLQATEVAEKTRLSKQLQDDWLKGLLVIDANIDLPDVVEAGHPQKPELLAPGKMPKRRLGSEQGRAAMIHAVAHIEFNAINLALDAVYRFRDMPHDFYTDWIQVAVEEVYHFSLVAERLQQLGYAYGDFPAHAGLWELAQKTAHDPMWRMALVPRVMEARGLDVTPGMMLKFERVDDQATVDILQIILADEIGHVGFGSKWFKYLCEQRELDAETTYFKLLEGNLRGSVICPLHVTARLEAGFSESELNRLQALCAKKH